MKHYGVETERVLDVGCALGYLTKRLVPAFREVHGVDISEYGIGEATKQAPSAVFSVVDLDAEPLPYQDGFFDLVTAYDVLEHTRSMEKTFAEISRVLRPGGYLFMSVPVRDSLLWKLFALQEHDLSHVSILSFSEISSIIERTGFEVLRRRGFLNFFFAKIPFIPLEYEFDLRKRE